MLQFKFWAFFKRDLQENWSYKTMFFMDAVSLLAQAVVFFYIAKLVSRGQITLLETYPGGFFSFVFLGIILASYHATALESFARAIYREQSAGTLEAILLSPTSLQTVVLSSLFWTAIFTTLRLFACLAAGFLFFRADFSRIDLVSAGITLFLTLSALSGLGLISAGLVLLLKRADPLSYFLNGISRLIAGVYFPAALLPAGVKIFSLFLPLTYSLEAMRKSVLAGAGAGEICSEWAALGIFSALFIPLGLFFFNSALQKARRDGSLGFS